MSRLNLLRIIIIALYCFGLILGFGKTNNLAAILVAGVVSMPLYWFAYRMIKKEENL